MTHQKRFQSILKIILITLMGLFFFVAYSALSWQSVAYEYRFNSPDETANYFFSDLFARTGSLSYQEPLLSISDGLIHPRSATAAKDRVVPVGFLGFPVIYGTLARMTGVSFLPFLTALLAVLGAYAFYVVLRPTFGRRVAYLSAFLLLIHPAYWYYASRGMMPNIAFVDLLLIGTAILFSVWWQKSAINAPHRFVRLFLHFLSGLMIGLALTVRLSELPWVAVVFSILFLCNVRKARIGGSLFFVLGCLAALSILFAFNAKTYGSPIIFGYQTINMVPGGLALEHAAAAFQHPTSNIFSTLWSDAATIMRPFYSYLLPFGFHPSAIRRNIIDYTLTQFWWLIGISIFGVLMLLLKAGRESMQKKASAIWVFIGIAALVTIWLAAYYGSWVVADNIAHEITIGNAYIRYWLPFFVLWVPFAAYGLVWLFDRRWYINKPAVVICVLFFLFLSIKITYWQTSDSLIPIRDHIIAYAYAKKSVESLTRPRDVIVSLRSDKIFFPDRVATQGFEGFQEAPLIRPLLEKTQVYYYGLWTPESIIDISRRFFYRYGLEWRYVQKITDNEYLYQVVMK